MTIVAGNFFDHLVVFLILWITKKEAKAPTPGALLNSEIEVAQIQA
jgi:hypothetical protein